MANRMEPSAVPAGQPGRGVLGQLAAPAMMTTRSASRSASASSWVVRTTQTPRSAEVGDDAPGRPVRPSGSTPAVGSSRKTTSGLPTRARASDSRCCSPPDSRRHGVRAHPAQADQVEEGVGVLGVVVVAGEEVGAPGPSPSIG